MTASVSLSAIREQHEAALFKVESIHHIHGDQCLCGFKSSISRDRTKHIMEATLAAAPSTVEQLLAIAYRVQALHPREVIAVHEGYGEEAWCPTCKVHWPCETSVAITGEGEA